MELRPHRPMRPFSVVFGVTSPPKIPDMYKVVHKKAEYRAEFEAKKTLGKLKLGELVEALQRLTDAKGVDWVCFCKPDFGRDPVGWAPLNDKKKVVLQLQPPPKVYGELGGSKVEFAVDVHPSWAPLASQRFRELCEAQFFVGCRFFRVVPGFVAQWGINGTPGAAEEWETLPDEPREQRNTAGTLAFANSGPGTRSTQLFVNYNDAISLDERDFVPFAELQEAGTRSMETLEGVFGGYGEEPDQVRIREEGNDYLRSTYPQLSFIHSVEIIEQDMGEEEAAQEESIALERMWSPRVDRYTGKPYVEHIHTGERRDAPPQPGEPEQSAQPQPAPAPADDFDDFSAFEGGGGGGGFAANFEDGEEPPAASGGHDYGDFGGVSLEDALGTGGPDYGDFGGVSLEDAMGGGWSDDDDDDDGQGQGQVQESVPPPASTSSSPSAVSWSRTYSGQSTCPQDTSIYHCFVVYCMTNVLGGAGTAPEEAEPPSPAAAGGFDWSGLWQCCYAPKSARTYDRIRLRQEGDKIIGVKAEGDSCLGSNWVLLEALLPPGATSGRGRRLLYAKKAGRAVSEHSIAHN